MELNACYLRALQIFLLVLGLTLMANAEFTPRTLYVNNICGQNITVSRALKLRLKRTGYLEQNVKCLVTLQPVTGTRLVASFITHEYEGHKRKTTKLLKKTAEKNVHHPPSGGYCHTHRIYLERLDHIQHFLGSDGYCKTIKPKRQYNLGSVGQFGFRTKSAIFIKPVKLELLITEIFDKDESNSCPEGYFDCGLKDYCVDSELTCNSYNDCRTSSDENGCGLSAGYVVLVVFCITIFLIIAIITIIITLRIWRK